MKAHSTLIAGTIVVLSLTAFQAPVQASQPLALTSEVVVEQTVEAPLADLTYETPIVTTIEAPVEVLPTPIVEPVVVAPVVEPVAVAPTVTTVTTVTPTVDVTTQPTPTTVAAAPTPVAPAVAAPVVTPPPAEAYWEPSTGVRMTLFQGDAREAMSLFVVKRGIGTLPVQEQQDLFSAYRGRYLIGYAPADTLAIPSATDPGVCYAYTL